MVLCLQGTSLFNAEKLYDRKYTELSQRTFLCGAVLASPRASCAGFSFRMGKIDNGTHTWLQTEASVVCKHIMVGEFFMVQLSMTPMECLLPDLDLDPSLQCSPWTALFSIYIALQLHHRC